MAQLRLATTRKESGGRPEKHDRFRQALHGAGIKDIAHVEAMPYDFVESPGMVRLKTHAGIKSPVETSSEILKTLKTRAEAALGGELVGAVITVPAYFDDAQRQATKDAARVAGLERPAPAQRTDGGRHRLRARQWRSEGVFAVYDLGGGTFDISILKLTQAACSRCMATSGDAALGGDDFDHRIYCWVIEQAKLPALAGGDAHA
jgi:molecular chaperone HscA